MNCVDDVILGGGVSGLGASYASDYRISVYEGAKEAGGLCAGFKVGGFTFDKAVHLSFATSDIVREVFDRTDYYTYNPYPKNWHEDRWIKHPVQNNLFALSVEERIRAVHSFVERPQDVAVSNFKDWNISRFGEYISENFVFKYNRKYWCEEPMTLGVQWIGNRLYQPQLDELLRGSYTDETQNTYYAKEMRYPKQGGFMAFLDSITQKASIHCSKKVIGIDEKERIIYFSDDTQLKYKTAFSSIPLTDMPNILKYAPHEVINAANKLNYTGVALVSVGFRSKNLISEPWFYIYDTDILAARVHSPSVKSPNNAPDGCSSLQFEIYFNGRENPPTKETCIENTIYALKKLNDAGGISFDAENDILFIDYHVIKYGNVIMYAENDVNSAVVKNYLKEHGIIPIGRFGEWDYLWSDQAFISGYRAIKTRNDNS